MLRFRLTLMVLVTWLFVFYNIERIHKPFNIASFVYVLSAAGGILLICKRGARRTLGISVFLLCLVLLILLKSRWNYPIVGAALPITLTEAWAMGLTFFLASRLSEGVDQFEEGAFELARVRRTDDIESGQATMYSEVRRARRFSRPLAVVYLRGETSNFRQAIHPLIEQTQREMAERLVRAKIAEAIHSELRDCDLLSRSSDGFVLMLPEATREDAEHFSQRVERAIAEQFGVPLKMGVATFPAEELTFRGLLRRAASATDSNLETESPVPAPPLGQVSLSSSDESFSN